MGLGLNQSLGRGRVLPLPKHLKALEIMLVQKGVSLTADHVLDELPQTPGPVREFFPTRPDDSSGFTARG